MTAPESMPPTDGDEKSGGLVAMPFMLADIIRFVLDVLVYGAALAGAGMAFVQLWQCDALWAKVLAFPAAYVALILGFYVALLVLRILFLRKIEPGTHKLTSRRALRWIVADSLMRLVERSPLRGYLKDFALQRFLFYRAMGARIAPSFLIGWDTRILDPWALEVGRNVLIGSFAVVSGHSVEGDSVTIAPVRIGDGATIGMRSVVLPGVEIGAGAIIGAGALVTKGTKVPSGEIWAGVPARKIGDVNVTQAPSPVPE